MHTSFVFAILALLATSAVAQNHSPNIRLNQIGFYPDAQKVAAIVDAPSATFSILTADLSESVFTGPLARAKMWTPAQEMVRLADFSELTREGEFVLVVPDLGHSYPFEIRHHAHQNVAAGTIKSFYFQRVSAPLEPAFSGQWARAAGHPDTSVEVHPSASSPSRPAGTLISASYGWYDAGDYNKYIVNSGITTGTMLMLYEHFPDYFAELDLNIPESDNDVPDLLDEILWNIRWMLAMQDPSDGGVYHKLTTAFFSGFVMPSQATEQRYVVKKGTAAALNFAAVMALGSRQYRSFENVFPGLADSMLVAADRAWNWAQANPEVPYDQGAVNAQYDPDIHTGAYGDSNFFDEFRWAASELFITTKADSFLIMYPPFVAPPLSAPSWPYVDPMGFISLNHHRRQVAGVVDTTEISGSLLTLANQYVNLRRESPIGTVMGASSADFWWGANSLAANQGMVLIQAFRLTRDSRYLDAAIANLDYLLGRNATGYSFVTGFGDRTPMRPHHRQSQADRITQPVPGLLVGGPNPNQEDGCEYPSDLPAKSYLDDVCSYASNENAINWNASIVYLAGAIEAIMSPDGRPTAVAIESDRPEGPAVQLGFSFYPNPASDRLNVRIRPEGSNEFSLRLVDVLGREVVAFAEEADPVHPGTHISRIDVSALPAGFYTVVVRSGSIQQSAPVAVVR